MAYISCTEWKTEQIVDWLKGLDFSMYRYLTSFTNNQINGMQLLNIRPYELEELGIKCIGHQEIILEALEVLKNFHYNLDKENLQYLALHVATSAHSLYKQLSVNVDQNNIETKTLKEVTRTISHIKKLILWLDRPPFQGQHNYYDVRTTMLKLGLEMATCAQRGRFVENPVGQICFAAKKLAKLADCVIQDMSDSMILQPATLDLVTLKKRDAELGFYVLPTFYGIHQITEIKYNSPAHNSNKIEEGDEIVQINYQTVVGWQYEKVLLTLRESVPDVLLTIKKRPKHTKMYGQVYIKPYRLPSKKRSFPYRWGDSASALPSPRADFLSTQDYFRQLKPLPERQNSSDSDSSSSDIFVPVDTKVSRKEELYLQKTIGVLQRRHSICGDGYSMIKALDLVTSKDNKDQRLDDSPSLRDKSVSFGFGLEMSASATRPTTHLGIPIPASQSQKDNANTKPEFPIKPEIKPKPVERKLPPPPVPIRTDSSQNNQLKENSYDPKDDKSELQGISKVVRFDSNAKLEHIDTQYTCSVENTVLETFVPIMMIDDDIPAGSPSAGTEAPIPAPKLQTSVDTEVPPAIEPRQGTWKPTPPPRPSKNLSQSVLSQQNISMAEALVNTSNSEENKSKVANVVALKQTKSTLDQFDTSSSQKSPIVKDFPGETLELFTSTNSKALTLKKKNSLLSKRRKVSLKHMSNSDIQGHLYRRTKNQRHGTSYWAKLYVVLLDTALYGFKTKQSTKADCLIYLSGFTVAVAQEIHSKSFPFKVYHRCKTFYFAAETEDAQKQWIEYIHQATLKASVGQKMDAAPKDIKELFSETDSSDDEFEITNKSQLATPSPITYNSSSGSNIVKNNGGEPSTPTTTKSEGKYHLGFGSLKKSLRNLNSSENSPSDKFLSLFSSSRNSERKNSLDVPIPTSQFKSYRKMPINVNLQSGTVVVNSNRLEQVSSHTRKLSDISLKRNEISMDFQEQKEDEEEDPIFEGVELGKTEARKHVKPSGYNYMHASNPNLVEFQAYVAGPPKPIELIAPKTSNANRDWDASHSLNGFITLKDLMLQEQAQNAKDPYNKRVCLGVEKSDDRNLKRILNNQQSNITKNEENAVDNENRLKINKIQKRSLPVTPDYAQSFKPDDQDILYTRSREGQKLRDFGYELITGDDRIELKNNAVGLQRQQQQHQQENDAQTHLLGAYRLKKGNKVAASCNETVMQSVKKRSMNWMQLSDKEKNLHSRGGSFNKKHKNKSAVIEKIDHLKASSEKLFNFKHVNTANETENLKNKHTNVKSNVITTNWNLVDNVHAGSTGSVSAASSNSDRGASYLTKLSFSSKNNKEKKLLGSPRLHRAIFGHRSISDKEIEPKSMNHEIFSPISCNKVHNNENANKNVDEGVTNLAMDVSPSSLAPPISSISIENLTETSAEEPHNIEYPPIFEAEIYSLSDLSSNLLIKRRQNVNNK